MKGRTDELREEIRRELLDIESRPDLTDDQKAHQVIVIFSTVCAGIAVQPIPFADFFILTPLQAYMGTRLSAIRGIPLSEKQANDLIVEIMGVVGLGMVAQQLGITAAKLFFPIFGGFATIPVVFSLTYAIGKVMDAYFIAKTRGETLSKDRIRTIWRTAKQKGREEGKKREETIRSDENA